MSLLPKVTEYALACVLFRLYHAIFIGRITLIFLHDNRFDASDLIRGILKLLNKRTCARFIYFVPTGSLLRTTWKGNNSTFQHICQQLSKRHDRADRQLSPSLPVLRLVSQRKLRLTSNSKPMTRQQQDFISHIYIFCLVGHRRGPPFWISTFSFPAFSLRMRVSCGNQRLPNFHITVLAPTYNATFNEFKTKLTCNRVSSNARF